MKYGEILIGMVLFWGCMSGCLGKSMVCNPAETENFSENLLKKLKADKYFKYAKDFIKTYSLSIESMESSSKKYGLGGIKNSYAECEDKEKLRDCVNQWGTGIYHIKRKEIFENIIMQFSGNFKSSKFHHFFSSLQSKDFGKLSSPEEIFISEKGNSIEPDEERRYEKNKAVLLALWEWANKRYEIKILKELVKESSISLRLSPNIFLSYLNARYVKGELCRKRREGFAPSKEEIDLLSSAIKKYLKQRPDDKVLSFLEEKYIEEKRETGEYEYLFKEFWLRRAKDEKEELAENLLASIMRVYGEEISQDKMPFVLKAEVDDPYDTLHWGEEYAVRYMDALGKGTSRTAKEKLKNDRYKEACIYIKYRNRSYSITKTEEIIRFFAGILATIFANVSAFSGDLVSLVAKNNKQDESYIKEVLPGVIADKVVEGIYEDPTEVYNFLTFYTENMCTYQHVFAQRFLLELLLADSGNFDSGVENKDFELSDDKSQASAEKKVSSIANAVVSFVSYKEAVQSVVRKSSIYEDGIHKTLYSDLDQIVKELWQAEIANGKIKYFSKSKNAMREIPRDEFYSALIAKLSEWVRNRRPGIF